MPIVLLLGILFSFSTFSGLTSVTPTSLNIRSTDPEKLLVITNTIFQEASAQNEEEGQSTEIEEPDQDQPPPPECEKTTAVHSQKMK